MKSDTSGLRSARSCNDRHLAGDVSQEECSDKQSQQAESIDNQETKRSKSVIVQRSKPTRYSRYEKLYSDLMKLRVRTNDFVHERNAKTEDKSYASINDNITMYKSKSKDSQQAFKFIHDFIHWYRNEYSYTYDFYCKYRYSADPIIKSSINEINKYIRGLFLKQYKPRTLDAPAYNIARIERSFDFVRLRLTHMYNEYLEKEIIKYIEPIPKMIEIDESLYVLELLLSLIHIKGSPTFIKNRILEVRRSLPSSCRNAHIRSFLDYAYSTL